MDHKLQDKRIEKGEQTRVRILKAAIEIIAESGMEEVSAAKLASATGMSKSNIFHHFRSIDEILLGVLHIIFSDMLKPLGEEYKSLDEFLHLLGQSVFSVPKDQLKLFRAFFSFYQEGMFRSEYQQALGGYTEQLIALLCKQLARFTPEEISEETLRAAAILLLSIMDGMGLHYLLNKDSAQFEQAWLLQVKMMKGLLSSNEYPA